MSVTQAGMGESYAGSREVGPLEQRHMQSAAFRAASDNTKVTPTHWHIAVANGLGWGFDGMDGVIFAIVAPFVIKEFAVDLGTYRSGVQIAMLFGIIGLYFWPWLADKFGRRNLLAINIAMFSLSMPLVAMSQSFWMFVAMYALVRFSLNGEWAIGSMLVAETWPARLRGLVISADRSTWGIGAALAGGIAALIVEQFGWRAAFYPPAVIALIAIYVRMQCPESPYWVRMMDRKNRLKARLQQGQRLSAEDEAWYHKADKVGIKQLFAPDLIRNTLLSTFVASTSVIAFSTVGLWMPLFLKEQHGFSAAEYGTFYVWWGLVGVTGICFAGWFIDKLGRRLGFAFMLLQATVFMTWWIFATDKTTLLILGFVWGWGFLGVWGPITTYTAEMYPTRIRGVGNGFSWTIGMFCGYVLWPFVSVYLRQTTGSFQAAFLLIPAIMVLQTIIIWVYSPEYARKELDAIAT
ncbi:MAG: MFS transporter [Acetobacteraceae bacterium]|nr:MFS transporter [Pseudomonadota bacterium]